MTELAFFIGKGGVGKTTISSAYAAHLAAHKRTGSVLLLSTDPAHSLSDIFNVRLGGEAKRLPRSQLSLWQIDSEREFRRFLSQNGQSILSLLESGTMFSASELQPLLDSTLPGMAEVAALLTIATLVESGEYSSVVVDTAPAGHTLRLFQLPETFMRLLDLLQVAADRDRVLAAHFAHKQLESHPFVVHWRKRVQFVRNALNAPESRTFLVTTPEPFALQESVRIADALKQAGDPVRISDVVLNRAVLDGGSCVSCVQHERSTKTAQAFLRKHFRKQRTHISEDLGGPPLGLELLNKVGGAVFAGRKTRITISHPKPHKQVKLIPATWPLLGTPLAVTIGKGGVGKTTLSAALAYHTRQCADDSVTICSTDPAPSLDDVFRSDVNDKPAPVLNDERLLAVEIDAAQQWRSWADSVKSSIEQALTPSTSGIHVELSQERRVVAALLDLVPPGMDEIAAIFRMVEFVQGGSSRLLIDMAPTGHALELLRMPDRILHWSRLLLKSLVPHRTLSLARDLAVQIAEIQQRVRDLAGMLKDRRGCTVFPLMLAEPLPDRETGRLLQDLEQLNVPVAPLFVNRVIMREIGGCERCDMQKRWQHATLASLRKKYRDVIYIAPDQPGGVAGERGLSKFTRQLWQIA